jgi:4-hydroxybutyrate CoA-transferase
MPRTLGDSFIHVSRINHLVPVDYPLPEMAMGAEEVSEDIERMAAILPN